MLTMEYIAAVREAYTGPDADWSRPCYSPLFADLRGLRIGICWNTCQHSG